MKIIHFIIAISASFLCSMASAQGISANSLIIANKDSYSLENIQLALDACILLSESAASKDVDALRKAREAIKQCNCVPFDSLIPIGKDENESLEGHLVFNVEFADSLLEGKDAYKNADAINKSRTNRGQIESGQILTKTLIIKANGKASYTFASCNRQELAVVAEPGGLITTRVHAVNKNNGIDEWHNDTIDVAKGRNSRKTAFTLPQFPFSQVTLEITNCTNKDISVVVISN